MLDSIKFIVTGIKFCFWQNLGFFLQILTSFQFSYYTCSVNHICEKLFLLKGNIFSYDWMIKLLHVLSSLFCIFFASEILHWTQTTCCSYYSEDSRHCSKSPTFWKPPIFILILNLYNFRSPILSRTATKYPAICY